MIAIIPTGGAVSTDAEQTLQAAEFFRALDPNRLEDVRGRLTETAFSRGKVLYFVGAAADYLWCVKRGEVRLYKSSNDGRITSLEVLGPGEIFGAVSALGQDNYPVSAEGVTNGAAWRLPRAHFQRLLDEDPSLARELLDVITRRLHEAHERVRSFAHDAAPSRLAQALLRAAHDGRASVTRRDLAEAAGTTVETAIRVLRGFEKEGVVEGHIGQIEITDPTALRRIARQ
jgi:CRP/FNR family transcriptional regulator